MHRRFAPEKGSPINVNEIRTRDPHLGKGGLDQCYADAGSDRTGSTDLSDPGARLAVTYS